MARLTVAPRNTPAERAAERITVEVDEDLSVYASTFEEWVTPRQAWALVLREGTDLGRANNVEVELEFAAGEQTSLLQFRLDQLDAATETGEELVLQFEERDGTARLARLSQTGLYVELFHVLTFT
jgi:hypothetical protein